MSEPNSTLILGDARDARDLDQFLTRAVGIRDGVVRVIARSKMAAFHVAAGFPLMLGAGAATFVAQRGVALAQDAELDVVVPISEVRDRLARLARTDAAGPRTLDVPPSRPSAPWTSTLPLGAAWAPVAQVPDDAWVAAARGVAMRVQEALPEQPGQPLVFTARDAVWSSEESELGAGVLSGAPFLAHAYGFLAPQGVSRMFSTGEGPGSWRRLSSRGGTLMWRMGAGSVPTSSSAPF